MSGHPGEIQHRCAPNSLGSVEACDEVTLRLEAVRRADELDITPAVKARLVDQILENARRKAEVHLTELQNRR